MKKYQAAAPTAVVLNDPVFAGRIQVNHEKTIPSALARCRETGRLDAFKLNWKPGMPNQPHVYWDSDVAKVVEGMALDLELHPDKRAEQELNDLVDLIVSAQGADGYLNTHFTVVAPEKRWTKIHSQHELYCAGHLMEAAVAHYHATGRRNFLDAMCRYADYIGTVFGPGEKQLHACPGHEEIELALCKLAAASGNSKYNDLAAYFIDERGQKPNYFVTREGVDESALEQMQAHRPVREQTEAVGHAVRAAYLYCGMADVAAAHEDRDLLNACAVLFENIRTRKMYITGGIGANAKEAFGPDWDLPNSSAYAESCAAIALVFFAQRMLNITGQAQYADVMERALYNGVLSGISLGGDEFFYQNMLEVNAVSSYAKTRQKWFSCSCCPTNFSRFLPQIGSLLWSESATAVRLHIPAAGTFESGARKIRVASQYPYDGGIAVEMAAAGNFEFHFRIPDWCKEVSVLRAGRPAAVEFSDGYMILSGPWQAGERLEITLAMPIRLLRANVMVAADAGRAAIMRGPLVYALESIDNKQPLAEMILPPDAGEFSLASADGLPAGTPAVVGNAWREINTENALYAEPALRLEPCRFTAIPYALWQNRGPAEMQVWTRVQTAAAAGPRSR